MTFTRYTHLLNFSYFKGSETKYSALSEKKQQTNVPKKCDTIKDRSPLQIYTCFSAPTHTVPYHATPLTKLHVHMRDTPLTNTFNKIRLNSWSMLQVCCTVRAPKFHSL